MTGPVSPVDPRDERLREITLAVLDVLRAQGRPELPRSSGTGLPKVVGVVRANWVLVVGIVTVALALFAWIVKGVSPLHAVDEVALRQEQRRLQRELVRRSIYLGNDFLNLGQTAAADSEFTQATALDPLDIEARFGLLKTAVFRSISLAAPDQELTERRLRAILEQRPGDTHALRFLGDVYANLDVDSAFAYYERALASDSANAHAYFGIAYLYDQQRKTDRAREYYARASAISPWNQTYLNNLGYANYQLGRFAAAESLYLRLIRLRGTWMGTRYMLAAAQLMLGDPRTALGNLSVIEDDLHDTVRLGHPDNQGEWFHHVDAQSMVRIHSARDKTVHGRYLLAVASYLNGREADARRHLRLIDDLGTRRSGGVDSIIWWELGNLRNAQPRMRPQIARLERIIWPQGFSGPRPSPSASP